MERASYQAEELKKSSKQFAIRVIRLFQALPKSDVARVLGRQLLRSGTGAAANYRAVCRARSKAELPRSELRLKKLTKASFGLSFLSRPELFRRLEWEAYLRKRTPCWPYSQPLSIPPAATQHQ